MRARIKPITVQGQIVNGRKIMHFVEKPLHIFCLELVKTITPMGRVVLRKEEEVVYKTRVRVAS